MRQSWRSSARESNRFIAVEVVVRNKNSDLEYLLQDVRVGTPDFVVSSYDKRIPRGVSEKAEQFSARAIILRLTAASASILTGIAGFAGNEILQDAANIVAGPFQTGLQSFVPNLSVAELARLDDLGFSVTSTVIPKNSAIAVVGFIPSDTLETAAHKKTKTIAKPFGWMRPSPNSFSTYQGDDLKALFSSLSVQVSGAHVQEVNPSQPALKLFIPSTANTILLSALKAGTTLTIQGSGLNSVTQVQLTNTAAKAVIPATLQPLKGEASIDPNVAQITIPAGTTYQTGTYEIEFILADGSTVDTKQSITVNADPPAE